MAQDSAEVSQSLMQDSGIESTSSQQSSPSSESASERYVPQSHVDGIVKGVKLDAYRKGREEALDEFKRQNSMPQTGSHISNSALGTDDVTRIATEAVQSQLNQISQQILVQEQQKEVNDLVQNFKTKMDSAKEKYSDFDDIVTDVDYGKIANVVKMATTQIDNTGDIMYELAKNHPTKLVELEITAREQPGLALRELRRLSESIKVNQAAAQVKRPNEPLSQLTQSNSGVDDGSNMSVSDFRKMFSR